MSSPDTESGRGRTQQIGLFARISDWVKIALTLRFGQAASSNWFCCKDLGGPNRAGLVLVLRCQFSELVKRAEPGRELAFADHVGHFDSLKRC